MSTEHTPGPWLLEQQLGTGDSDCGWSVLEREQNPYRGEICHITDAEHIAGITKAERDANARLIAAAPELLEAMRALVKHFPTDSEMDQIGFTKESVTEACDAYDAARVAIAKATGEQP